MERPAASTAKGQGRAPPYFAYGNFKAFIRDLRVNGTPPKIDRHSINGVPDTVRSQMMTGIRFLSLINGDDSPTDYLRQLVEVYERPEWSATLAAILRHAYSDIFALDLMNVTPGHLLEAFKPLAGSDEVRRKCYVFFLAAVKDAEIPLGPRLATSTRNSGGLPSRRRGARRKEWQNGNGNSASAAAPPAPAHEVIGPEPPQPAQGTDLINQLVGKFPTFDPSWPDNLKEAWFKGFEQFLQVTKSKT